MQFRPSACCWPHAFFARSAATESSIAHDCNTRAMRAMPICAHIDKATTYLRDRGVACDRATISGTSCAFGRAADVAASSWSHGNNDDGDCDDDESDEDDTPKRTTFKRRKTPAVHTRTHAGRKHRFLICVCVCWPCVCVCSIQHTFTSGNSDKLDRDTEFICCACGR